MRDTAIERLRRDFRVAVEVVVAWADMDALQHVNNSVFFRYFEVARMKYLERIGFVDEQAQAGLGPILASTHCRFRRPVTYPDRLLVGARTTEVKEDRFEQEYRIASEKLGEVVAEGGAVVVSYDYRSGRKAPLPGPVREAIARLEG